MKTAVKLFRNATVLVSLFLVCSSIYATEPEHPDADLFQIPPRAADASGKPACHMGPAYVELTNGRRYDELVKLFSPDAVFLTPIGKTVRGREEIRAFYSGLLSKMRSTAVPISFIADGQECVMELAATLHEGDGKYRLAAIDHFTVDNEGLIRHMIVYLRPTTGTPAGHGK